MIDFAKITVKAGDGGAGSGSFRHIKGKRYGKADGGSGGDGGNLYLEATRNLNTLEPYRYVKDYKASAGQRGLANLKQGARGGDLVLKVPMGTLVRLRTTDQSTANSLQTTAVDSSQNAVDKITDSRQLTVDLINSGQRVLVARGGQGGRGNSYLRDEYGRRPKSGESGQEGESANLTLELKLIADVGLIGLPNAGKSTLLSALTAAKPAISSYPFTTLEPNLGVLSELKLEARIISLKSPLIIADIPGLIEGASEGKGLGDLFLRHIERTRLLVHLIDATNPNDSWNSYQIVRLELKQYSKTLSLKKEIIVLAKIDLIKDREVKKICKQFENHRRNIIPVSAVCGTNLIALIETFKKRLRNKS